MQRTRAIAMLTAGLLALSVSGAYAGEITGNGKDTPIRSGVANSVCAFSGLNDFEPPEDPDFTGRTQNWGQIPSAERAFLRSIGVSPGALCRGNMEY